MDLSSRYPAIVGVLNNAKIEVKGQMATEQSHLVDGWFDFVLDRVKECFNVSTGADVATGKGFDSNELIIREVKNDIKIEENEQTNHMNAQTTVANHQEGTSGSISSSSSNVISIKLEHLDDQVTTLLTNPPIHDNVSNRPQTQETANSFVKQIESDELGNRFECHFEGCGTRYKHTHLICDNQTYSGVRPFKSCSSSWDGCDRSFVIQKHLETSLKMHTGKNLFVCSWSGCNLAFDQKCNLIKHRKMHSTTLMHNNASNLCAEFDPTQLDPLEFDFLQPSIQSIQPFSHESLKSSPINRTHKCKECLKSFSKAYLSQHVLYAHSSYPCDKCGIVCKGKHDLRTHLASHDNKLSIHSSQIESNHFSLTLHPTPDVPIESSLETNTTIQKLNQDQIVDPIGHTELESNEQSLDVAEHCLPSIATHNNASDQWNCTEFDPDKFNQTDLDPPELDPSELNSPNKTDPPKYTSTVDGYDRVFVQRAQPGKYICIYVKQSQESSKAKENDSVATQLDSPELYPTIYPSTIDGYDRVFVRRAQPGEYVCIYVRHPEGHSEESSTDDDDYCHDGWDGWDDDEQDDEKIETEVITCDDHEHDPQEEQFEPEVITVYYEDDQQEEPQNEQASLSSSSTNDHSFDIHNSPESHEAASQTSLNDSFSTVPQIYNGSSVESFFSIGSNSSGPSDEGDEEPLYQQHEPLNFETCDQIDANIFETFACTSSNDANSMVQSIKQGLFTTTTGAPILGQHNEQLSKLAQMEDGSLAFFNLIESNVTSQILSIEQTESSMSSLVPQNEDSFQVHSPNPISTTLTHLLSSLPSTSRVSPSSTSINSPMDKPFECDRERCYKSFNCKDYLAKHIRRVHSDKLYKCDFGGCVKVYKRAETLSNHKYAKKHQTSIDQTFKCDQENCNKSFPTRRGLGLHFCGDRLKEYEEYKEFDRKLVAAHKLLGLDRPTSKKCPIEKPKQISEPLILKYECDHNGCLKRYSSRELVLKHIEREHPDTIDNENS